jgi:UDP-N-acetylmuramyl pentapeptide synthase
MYELIIKVLTFNFLVHATIKTFNEFIMIHLELICINPKFDTIVIEVSDSIKFSIINE